MSKVLIGNGLDKSSLLPLKVGTAIAKSLGKQPVIVHADKLADYETLDSVFAHLNLEVHKNYIQSILEANNSALEKQLETIGLSPEGLSVESKSGRPAEVLLNEAKDQAVDMIVIGHNHDNGIAEFFLGSVTESITHQADKPVLVVKTESCAAPKKIMVAYNFSYHCEQSLNWAIEYAKIHNAEIELVNVLPCFYQGYHVAHSLSNNFNEALDEMIKESQQKIQEKLDAKKDEIAASGVKVTDIVILDKDGSISEKLVEHINKGGVDLVAMGTHARGKITELFLGSVANNIIKKSKVSVLISK